MKILMLLFTQRRQGTYYRAFPWATYLASRGHNVTVLCTSTRNLFQSTITVENGVRIIETPALFHGQRIMSRLCGMCGWGPLDIAARVRILRTGNYDVVHAFEHHLHITLPIYLAGRKHIPVLISDWCDHYGKGGLRGYEYSPYRLRRLYKRLGLPAQLLVDYMEGALRRHADAVTVISTWLRQRALDVGVRAEKIHLIPGSAETELITPTPSALARKKLGLDETLQYTLFLGAGQFDLDFCLDAFSQVVQKIPMARFIVVGRKYETVTKQAARLGLQDKVIQTGWIDDSQLNDWLACADVCLLPMKDHLVNYARWPNKIGFYMAAGRPTVATAIGDVGQLIPKRDIGMVSEVDPSDFADKIQSLLNHPVEAGRKGQNARQLAEQEFANPIQGEALEQLYSYLLAVSERNIAPEQATESGTSKPSVHDA